MSDNQKVEAIRARVMGVWDHPQLLKLGPLSADILYDVAAILDFPGEVSGD